MNKHFKTTLFFFILISAWSCHRAPLTRTERPSIWAQKVYDVGLDNIYKVDRNLYRSEQLHAESMLAIEKLGIKTVLNLRRTKKDKVRNTSLILEQVRINTSTISYNDVVKSLQIIDGAKKPVLVHCWHGSDRTGCIVAAYRMVYNDWTKEQAIQELIEGGYGYHKKWFPNIIELLNSLDVEKLKHDVNQ